MKVRYAETKQVRDMRETFERSEKIALRSSRTYKVILNARKNLESIYVHLNYNHNKELERYLLSPKLTCTPGRIPDYCQT